MARSGFSSSEVSALDLGMPWAVNTSPYQPLATRIETFTPPTLRGFRARSSTIKMPKNGKEYALEVVVREKDWTILHLLFK